MRRRLEGGEAGKLQSTDGARAAKQRWGGGGVSVSSSVRQNSRSTAPDPALEVEAEG